MHLQKDDPHNLISFFGTVIAVKICMPIRKNPLYTDGVYHVFNRSIAGYIIFNNAVEFERMRSLLNFCRLRKTGCSFSHYLKSAVSFSDIYSEDKHIKIIAYCLMPTHFHLILQQLRDGGISDFMMKVQDSYSLYFNKRHKRKGPLWEAPFKNVPVATDEQLLHLTRYLHINPTTAALVTTPIDWEYSSYREYLKMTPASDRLCAYDRLLDISPDSYRKFINDQIDHQRDLGILKKLLFD